ncbi:type ISP restriction/modification enzyme [Ignavibacterium sp.]|uniref:type ISP restriction/modification enzyme n=1 Tax=Ignavibacterium sp. TaxID=2651167 RepID=UPI00307DB97C
MAKVYHAEIFGLREAKYNWLNKNDIKKAKWSKLEPKSEFYLFIPQDIRLQSTYRIYWKITEIFPVNSVGIVTARDNLTIGWNEVEIWNRVQNFARLEPELARQTYKLGKDVRDWKVTLAQNDLIESGLKKENLVDILYRPFDKRKTYYTGKSRGFHCMPRGELMKHLLVENIAICIGRQWNSIGSETYDICYISDCIVDLNLYRRGGEMVYPLYLYPETHKKDLFSEHESGEKKPNIKPELFEELKIKYKKEVTPEEIFYYIYAVLYSNTYRTKYAEFLKIDFPRIPFTSNYKLFIKLGKLGKELADLHLLKSDELNNPISKFSGRGDSKVTQRPKYEDEKVYINGSKYFNNVEEEVWKYQIGGYQVCDKWLKDRKGRELSLDEIQTYCKIVTALSKTIELQKKIDENYEGVEN